MAGSRARAREEERAAKLAEVESDLEKCRRACEEDGRNWSSVVGLQRLALQLKGLDAPPETKKRRPKRTGDHLVDHLADLRQLLDLAVERGSVDSAARLTRQIRDTIDQIEARDAQRQAEEMASRTAEEVIEELIAMGELLPLPLRKRLVDRLAV